MRSRFFNLTLDGARSLGYTLLSECVVRPTDGHVMGYHAYKPGSLDGRLDPLDPEILLLLPQEGTLRVIGVEWEAVGSGTFTVLSQTLERVEGHPGMWFPHHALHLYFVPNNHFGDFSSLLTGRCTPLPVADSAFANLANAGGEQIGTVRLNETALGVIEISLEARGLPPGVHAVHLHETGRCDAPDFTSAGGHFNPLGKSHGIFFTPAGPHAGDIFGAGILVAPDGTARWPNATERVSLTAGPARLFDFDGAAVIVHVGPDDHRTDPTGAAGGRIACGVLARGEPVTPAPAPEPAAPAAISPPSTGDGGVIATKRSSDAFYYGGVALLLLAALAPLGVRRRQL